MWNLTNTNGQNQTLFLIWVCDLFNGPLTARFRQELKSMGSGQDLPFLGHNIPSTADSCFLTSWFWARKCQPPHTITKALSEFCCSWLRVFCCSIPFFNEPTPWSSFTSLDVSIVWKMIKSNNDIQSVNLYRGHSIRGTSHPSLSYLINCHQPGYILSDIVSPVMQCHTTFVLLIFHQLQQQHPMQPVLILKGDLLLCQLIRSDLYDFGSQDTRLVQALGPLIGTDPISHYFGHCLPYFITRSWHNVLKLETRSFEQIWYFIFSWSISMSFIQVPT